jgi:guanosine-3',5'-bis(diphosphate) 3'-pyrophosphohydrolase
MTPEEAIERHRGALTELLLKIEKKNPGFDRDLVTRAFETAVVQHRSQLRASGEDYVNHPIGTAIICAELGLDSSTLAAALLHDVVEDTGYVHHGCP